MDWVLAHESALQSYALIGTFALVAVAECVGALRPAAASLVQRWISNVSFAVLGAALARLALPFAAVAAAYFAEQHRWGVLNAIAMPPWISMVFGLLALDASTYALHRLVHAVPLLWRVHQIHHSDLDIDCGTAIRHHPIESLISHGFTLASVIALGAPPIAVVISEALQTSASLFNHANIALPPWLQKTLRHALVTPQMHHIHHSVTQAESNSNFGNLLPWWDRLFGTYCAAPARGDAAIEFGIACAPAPADVTLWKLLLLPFRAGEQGTVLTHATAPAQPGGLQ